MNMHRYTIILHSDVDEGGYTVTIPSLPGCITQGDTLEEAIAMAKDAIKLHLVGTTFTASEANLLAIILSASRAINRTRTP